MKRKYDFCKMHILLISATSFEIEPTLELLKEKKNTIGKHTTEVLITGVGQVNTAYLLAVKLLSNKPDLVLQAGIAGCFSGQLSLGQTVLIKQDAFGDSGIEEKQQFATLFDAGFAGKNDYPFTDGWLVNDTTGLFQTSALVAVKGITVNKISDTLLQKQQLIEHFNPAAESMEGAAFHYVCLQQKVPFLQIRSVSNAVGERDKTKWAMKDAIINLNIELQKILISLP
ncbi:MAG: mqnB [Ferruginibacter sp.]|uniref:futalosine hydrolase n=1 Tax=Ferruginibacter sp. TaxID=1940288 RepID=UPI0026584ABD|nr:futalosine hydrolase [Ferruginibacter sp.]MDB5277738.1 mqnB [Ferruginibacter sp.]